MAKIRLKFAATCADKSCGAYLPVGTLVRYYGRNGIFGIHCHTKSESLQAKNGIYREQQQGERDVAFESEQDMNRMLGL